MGKKILRIEGWGLHRDPQLMAMLEARHGRLRTYNLDTDNEAPQFQDFDLILATGALGSAFSDSMLTKRIALRLQKILRDQRYLPTAKNRIYAFGRAGLAFMQSHMWAPFNQKSLDYRPLSNSGPWRKCQVPDLFPGVTHGLQLCEEAWDPGSPIFQSAKPWATSVGVPCAWKFQESLFVSDVDFFALKETSLLPDYGYFDSSKVSTADHLLDKLLL